MRTEILYSNQDATIASTSIVYDIDCGQDMRWQLQIKKTTTDGSPKLYVEISADGLEWDQIQNYDCTGIFDFFLIDTDSYTIKDSYWEGKSMRLRVDPNDNTTGTIGAKLVVKTKSN